MDCVAHHFEEEGGNAPHRCPIGAVACDLLFMLTCAVLMTASHSKARIKEEKRNDRIQLQRINQQIKEDRSKHTREKLWATLQVGRDPRQLEMLLDAHPEMLNGLDSASKSIYCPVATEMSARGHCSGTPTPPTHPSVFSR